MIVCTFAGRGSTPVSTKAARSHVRATHVHCSPVQDTQRDEVNSTRRNVNVALISTFSIPGVASLRSVAKAADVEETTVPVKPKTYIASDFLFQYPRGWKISDDAGSSGDSMTGTHSLMKL